MASRIPIRIHVEKTGMPANPKEVWKKILVETGRDCGHDVDVVFKRVTPHRSPRQLKAVMGYWMGIILEELGYHDNDRDYIYGQLKIEMGWTEDRVNKKTGLVEKVPRPTRTLDKDGYSKFMENFRDHLDHHHNIILPPPDRLMAVI